MKSNFLKLNEILASALLASPIAFADETPADTLESTVSEVLAILDDSSIPSVKGKRQRVLQTLDRSFSFDIIIRGTLGRNWDKLDEAQRESITKLATDLLIQAYVNEFSDTERRPQVVFKKAIEHSSKRIEVPTVVTVDGKEIQLNYRMAKLRAGWQVYDILIEGISLVSNYRSQFDEHFQTKNADQLIEVIEEKLQNI